MDAPSLIHAARDRAALTQEQLAAAAGTSQAAVARYERGSIAPSVTVLTRLLAACGLEAQVELVPLYADLDSEIRACLDRAPADRLVDLGWDRFFENLAERRVRYVMGGEIAALLHGVVTSVCDRAEDFDVDLARSVTVAVGPIDVAVVPVEDALEAVGHARLVERFRDLTRGETPP